MAKSLMGEALPRSNLSEHDIQKMFDAFHDHTELARTVNRMDAW